MLERGLVNLPNKANENSLAIEELTTKLNNIDNENIVTNITYDNATGILSIIDEDNTVNDIPLYNEGDDIDIKEIALDSSNGEYRLVITKKDDSVSFVDLTKPSGTVTNVDYEPTTGILKITNGIGVDKELVLYHEDLDDDIASISLDNLNSEYRLVITKKDTSIEYINLTKPGNIVKDLTYDDSTGVLSVINGEDVTSELNLYNANDDEDISSVVFDNLNSEYRLVITKKDGSINYIDLTKPEDIVTNLIYEEVSGVYRLKITKLSGGIEYVVLRDAFVSTDESIVIFDGVSGKTKDSGITIDVLKQQIYDYFSIIDGEDIDLPNTTNANKVGIIKKNGIAFLHNFNYGNNGTVTTVGRNIFLGEFAGNVTMGSTATSSSHSSYNVAQGYMSLYNNTTGSYNLSQGAYSLNNNTTGSNNVAQGYSSLRYNTTGEFNVAQGYDAGRHTSTGDNNNTANSSLFLGATTKAFASGGVNEIVIGANAVGNGSNTVTLGDDNITKTVLKGDIEAPSLTVNGFTKLGLDAPAIKMKKLTGTTASTQGGLVSIVHGLDSSKILSVHVRIKHAINEHISTNWTDTTGYQAVEVVKATNVIVKNVLASSSNILSKPFTITLVYEE